MPEYDFSTISDYNFEQRTVHLLSAESRIRFESVSPGQTTPATYEFVGSYSASVLSGIPNCD